MFSNLCICCSINAVQKTFNLKNSLKKGTDNRVSIPLNLNLKIIIYHDFLPLSRKGSHIKSDYAHTIIQQAPFSPYNRHLRLYFQKLHSFNSLPQAHQVTASHPFPGDSPPKRGRAVRKNAGLSKNARVKLNHLPHVPRFSTPS